MVNARAFRESQKNDRLYLKPTKGQRVPVTYFTAGLLSQTLAQARLRTPDPAAAVTARVFRESQKNDQLYWNGQRPTLLRLLRRLALRASVANAPLFKIAFGIFVT